MIARADHRPIRSAPVDLERFMGRWYVLAHIPARIEREAYGAIETYALAPDGTIDTTYRFRRGGFDCPERTLRARGFVVDGSANAEWRMQFLWPFRAEYLIAYIDTAYEHTIIARSKRDMAWIMARSPDVGDERLLELIGRLDDFGYDVDAVRRVPQAAVPAEA